MLTLTPLLGFVLAFLLAYAITPLARRMALTLGAVDRESRDKIHHGQVPRLGGTAIAGGRGLVVGTLIGAVLLGILNNGLNLMGINPYLQDIIRGVIILLAIYIAREWR